MLKYFLGLSRVIKGNFAQKKNALDKISPCGFLARRPAESSMEEGQKLALAEHGEMKYDSVYQHLVGILIYLMNTDPEMFYFASYVVLHCTSTSKRSLQDSNAGSALSQGQYLRIDITDQRWFEIVRLLRAHCEWWILCQSRESPVYWKTKT